MASETELWTSLAQQCLLAAVRLVAGLASEDIDGAVADFAGCGLLLRMTADADLATRLPHESCLRRSVGIVTLRASGDVESSVGDSGFGRPFSNIVTLRAQCCTTAFYQVLGRVCVAEIAAFQRRRMNVGLQRVRLTRSVRRVAFSAAKAGWVRSEM